MSPEPRPSFQAFFDRYYGIIYQNFLSRTQNRAEAEDLTQDTFMRAAKNYAHTKAKPSLRWLVKIADNVFKNWLRYHHAAKREGLEQSMDALGEPQKDSQNQEDRVIMGQQIQALTEAICALPVQMRRCFELYYLQEYKYYEIAVLLGINIQTVKSHLNRARKKVVGALKNVHDERRRR